MLKTTRKIKGIYEDIQKMLFYMIPEKWEELYLYSSVLERFNNVETGELFFYYIPKGILRKNPVNVYEIPSKFNLEEGEYLRLVELLYDKIKELRNEHKKQERKTWSNLTIIIKDMKFRVEYDYEDIQNSEFDSFQRHIIWRSKYLNVGMEKVSKAERAILERYYNMEKNLTKTDEYEESIIIKDVKNMVDYQTQDYETTQNIEYMASKNDKKRKNQILMMDEEQ